VQRFVEMKPNENQDYDAEDDAGKTVEAESLTMRMLQGAVAGGLMGVPGGPVAAVVGAAVGAIAGETVDESRAMEPAEKTAE